MDQTYPHKKIQPSKTPPAPVSTIGTPAKHTSNETESDSANSENSIISIGWDPLENLLPTRLPVILTIVNTDEDSSTETVNVTGAPSSEFQANTAKSNPRATQTEVEFTGDRERSESPNGLLISRSSCPVNQNFQTAVRAVISETKVQEICDGQLVQARIPWEMSDGRVTVWVNCSFLLQQ